MNRDENVTPFLAALTLALLLPLLILACGGSDEAKDLTDSERATSEATNLTDSERAIDRPEGRACSGQTTAEPITGGTEPSHTPKATAIPPMAQTSPETDREALVALYNATGGPNWNSNHYWLSDVPISGWSGVNTDDNGRVNYLLRRDNQLSGEIPPDLGNLFNLTVLGLGNNQLSGCVPSSLLDRLNMDSSDLGGLQFCP